MLHDRLVNDYSTLIDSFELEFDNSCHFTNIETAYEGGTAWICPQQVIYSPIFGENIESEDPEIRDVSLWEVSKTIVFILNNISTHIWVHYIEDVKHIYSNIEIYPAYCNLDPPNCAFNRASIADQVVETYQVRKDDGPPPLDIPMHVHKPRAATSYNKYPVLILVPPRLAAGSSFDANNMLTGIPDAQRFTAQGYVTVHFDVEGRGALDDYTEDFNGYVHQESFKLVFEKILSLDYVDLSNIGVLSFGYGNAMALGAITRYNLAVKYIVDFEGAVDRDDIAGCDGTYGIFSHQCEDDELWWLEREPKNFVEDLECYYLRVQYETSKLSFYDSVMGLVNGAVASDAGWVRINDKVNKVNKHYLLHEYPIWLDERAYTFLKDMEYVKELTYMPPIYKQEDAIIVEDVDNHTIDCSVADRLSASERLCASYDMRKRAMLRTFIDAIMLRGYADEFGNCPHEGALAYLCRRRGYDVNVRTLHQDTRNRLKSNINTLFLSTAKRLNTNLVSLHFDDEYQQLDGSYRRFKKFRTNIAVYKPLKYKLRMSPPLDTIINSPVTPDTKLLTIYRNRFTFNTIEVPITKGERTESLNFYFAYSRNYISPPADIIVSVESQNASSTTQFPLLGMQIYQHLTYKLPICLYVNPSNETHTTLSLSQLGVDYPFGTFGWAMKQRIQFVFPNPTAATGYYNYYLIFKIRIPTVFNEAIFGDFFSFTEFEERFPLQINVFT